MFIVKIYTTESLKNTPASKKVIKCGHLLVLAVMTTLKYSIVHNFLEQSVFLQNTAANSRIHAEKKVIPFFVLFS